MMDVLTLAQLLCLALLFIGAPIYEFFKLKWRAEEAERNARSERLRCKRLEIELEQLQQIVRDLQRSSPVTLSSSIVSDSSLCCSQNLSEATVVSKTVTA